MDRPSSPRPPLLAALCLVAAACGGFLGGMFVAQPPAGAPPSASDEDTQTAIEGLRTQIHARLDALALELRGELASLQAPSERSARDDSRTPARDPERELRVPDPGREVATPRQALESAPEVGVERLIQRIERFPVERWDEESERLDGEHLFWPLRDVLRVYGRPAEVSTTSGGILLLTYRHPPTELDATFELCDGLVTRVSIDH